MEACRLALHVLNQHAMPLGAALRPLVPCTGVMIGKYHSGIPFNSFNHGSFSIHPEPERFVVLGQFRMSNRGNERPPNIPTEKVRSTAGHMAGSNM